MVHPFCILDFLLIRLLEEMKLGYTKGISCILKQE